MQLVMGIGLKNRNKLCGEAYLQTLIPLALAGFLAVVVEQNLIVQTL